MEKQMKKSDLTIFLKQYNLWYQGMTTSEMHECRQALQNSLNESNLSNCSTTGLSNESAGHLSSLSGSDSSYTHCEVNYNCFSNYRRSIVDMPINEFESSPPSSPEVVQRFFTVKVDVHRPMNWSPEDADCLEMDKEKSGCGGE